MNGHANAQDNNGVCPSGTTIVGQNLAVEAGGNSATAGKEAVDKWYSEVGAWNASGKNAFLPAAGHYTQLVWKGSTKVGCAMATGVINGSTDFATVACDYYPPGNSGAYTQNVQ